MVCLSLTLKEVFNLRIVTTSMTLVRVAHHCSHCDCNPAYVDEKGHKNCLTHFYFTFMDLFHSRTATKLNRNMSYLLKSCHFTLNIQGKTRKVATDHAVHSAFMHLIQYTDPLLHLIKMQITFASLE